MGPKVFPAEASGKGGNISNQAKMIKTGFREKERPLDRTEVSETVRGCEERLTTEWVGLESVLREGVWKARK